MKSKMFKTAISYLIGVLMSFSLNAQFPGFDDDKPIVTYNAEYSQIFHPDQGWDAIKFYAQWDAMEEKIFGASDIALGYLQYEWAPKRILTSKLIYPLPYSIEAELNYEGGSNRGGVVIRAIPTMPDQVQEPPQGDPGFNSEGIAFYPNPDGASMVIQFTGTFVLNATAVTRIIVPKPSGVASLMSRGNLRIEDFGTNIYAYYNDVPLAKIELTGKSGKIYSSGTVYDADMNVVGTFTGMEVEEKGKVSICQRDARLKLYKAIIKYNELTEQSISFDVISKKVTTDAPFAISAIASSGLAVEFRLLSGPASLADNIVSLTGVTGIVSIAANQNGNEEYYQANEVIRSFYVSDANAEAVSVTSQDYVDQWVVTDALGRQLPSFSEAGSKRSDKLVGVFYYTWHGYHGDKVYDITKILKNYPAEPLSAANNAWGGQNAFHFWGEPETGYHRAEDPWVLRRDLQMLSNAHVDFLYIDVTNAITYLETIKALCEMSVQMRSEGIYTPEIAFTTHAYSGRVMNDLYDQFYSNQLFDNLWFEWQGKPLILGDTTDPELRTEVRDFFTIKYSWAWTNTKNEPDHWQWLDSYPQDYGWSTDPGIPEQVVVAMAQHPVSTTGTSFHIGAEPPVNSDYVTDLTGQGLHFAEQWKRALELDPAVIMVTQWNEWTAQRFIWDQGTGTYAGHPIKNGDTYFVDVFTEEFNRDMVPMKGGHTDNFYYQLISNIRKYKGMAEPQEYSSPQSISLDGDFSEWANVQPVYKDPKGDNMHRNFPGYDSTIHLINNTGRNDIIDSRITYDDNNIYFYVKTLKNISPSNDPNWMMLFIDADRNKGTGWEGYDWMINNLPISDTETSLQKYSGTGWGESFTVNYTLANNEMEMSIPRAIINMTQGSPEFYFKWADNPQHLDDVTTFFTDGDAAPDRRFNFNFSQSELKDIPQTPFREQSIPGIIELEDFDNGGGNAYADSEIGNSGGAYRLDESVDISENSSKEFYITDIFSKEWMEYTVDVNAIGLFNMKIYYAAGSSNQRISLFLDGKVIKNEILMPQAGTVESWANIDFDVRLKAGTQVLKVSVDSAFGALNIDRIVFTEKDVVYPGNGTGLLQTLYNGEVGGRNWFIDSICSNIDPIVFHEWTEESPGCGTNSSFWNSRWEGMIQSLYTEEYTFSLSINDFGRLWIDGQLLVDAWAISDVDKTHSAKFILVAGEQVPIKIDYANKIGGGHIKLEWESGSQLLEVIPRSQLYPKIITSIHGNQLDQDLLRIYPNPASNEVQIKAPVNSSIKIYTVGAQLIYSKILTDESSCNIDVSIWKPGLYFAKVQDSQNLYYRKLIIQ